ncbi:hypothetical protein HN681_01930 [archaeon]|jgi:hypothetical protein|nr:hypothetical protein [archaeon]MBT3731111.1 hypothetical protein [archaeon]MBT4670224.1 hypothetical protein [archaeon]MBT5030486.1 hypothetical protein [archaeon]MBT5287839.1 hypothetical protein [archaeon]
MSNRIVQLKEDILSYVSNRGPLLPSTVAKEFKGTNLFISALLSELVTNKKIKLSKAKIGGSPLYYCEHQKDRLYALLKDHAGKKQKEALDLLFEKKVLRDRDCLPFERVAFREMIDFARPVRLIINETEELFWRWYMLADSDAKDLIEVILEDLYGLKEEKKKEVEEIEVPEPPKVEVKEEAKVEVKEEAKVEVKEEVKVEVKEEVKVEVKEEAKVEVKEDVEKEVPEEEEVVEVKVKKKVKKKVVKKKKVEVEKQKKLKKENEEVDEIVKDKDLLETLNKYMASNGIEIIRTLVIKNNREINMIVKVPSQAGDLKYFVKARKRKRLNEGDLLLAFTESQTLKLPILYFSNAELSKKTQDYIKKNIPGMNFIKLDNLE